MWRLVLVAVIGTLLFGVVGIAQMEPPTSFVVSDLELISTSSKPDWSDRWSGPVEGATILAWFHDHSFSNFLRDLNGDGVVDELDTIELADAFGKAGMRTNSPLGTTDARLVGMLAKYVAEKYADEFELKIYDQGFPTEFNREFPVPFASDAVPGIVLTLEDQEPNFQSYQEELMSAEGVIIGIEQDERLNYYLAGRSFLYEKTPNGNDGIDLAWGKEDSWTPGVQGQVLTTESKETDAWYILYQGKWVKVEFMLALSPVVERDKDTADHGSCPEEAIGYDVSTTATDYGDVKVEECVTRDGNIDTYTYTVTNVSFEESGCGICHFGVMNTDGFTTVDQSGPGTWLINPNSGEWEWAAPLGSCGIQIGESAVFWFSVLGLTYDVPVNGFVSTCEADPDHPPVWLRVLTTGPSDTPSGCPDLTIKVHRSDCSCQWNKEECVCTVDVYATVKNIGDQAATHFYCKVHSDFGGDQKLVVSLDPGATHNLHFQFSFTVTGAGMPSPPCPLSFQVMADSHHFIHECDENNNTDSGSVCCQCYYR